MIRITRRAISVPNNEGLEPIHIAARDGDLNTIINLIENKAKVNAVAKNEFKETALHFAAKNGHLDIVKYLLDHKAKLHQTEERGFEAIHLAAENGHLEVLRYLVEEKKVKPNIKATDDFTPIQAAILKGHLPCVQFLVEKGVDINQTNSFLVKMSLLEMAAGEGYMDICKYLVDQGANVNAKDKTGDRASDLAAQKGHIEVAEYLKSLEKNSACCIIQ